MHLSTVLLTLSLTATSLASFCYPTGNSALTSAVTARHRQFCTYASRYSPINPGEKVSFTYETTLPNGAPGRIFYQYHNKSNKKWYILQTPCEADIGWDLDGGCAGYAGYHECTSSDDVSGDTTACVEGMGWDLDLQLQVEQGRASKGE
ncbi:Protein of unknown function [Pyronema omphalodes CBS 100304]|uniref:Uncharacterized protein n=1 Tax=Pyronema omphalodes (strain CBS 100304) TaxID=1076935 RepID=U4LG41_PYROM|nr:Protein of unknown function [Pyronema omphalodes CBS 100304]